MDGIDVPFNKVQELSGEQVYAHIKKQLPQGQGRRRDLHARLRLAHARHHRDAGAGPAGAGGASGHGAGLGIPEAAACARAAARLRPSARGPAVSETSHDPIGDAQRWSFCCCGLVLRAAGGRRTSGSAVGRAVLQGPHRHDAGRHRAGRHQRHLGAPRGAPSRPLHSGQSEHHRAEQAGRRRPRHRQPPLFQRPRRTARCSPSSSAPCRSSPSRAIRNAQFDPTKFTWLGSLSSYADDAYLMLVNADIRPRPIADLKTPGISVALGADNAASSNLIFAVIAKEVLGLNVNVVRGYTGAAPMFLAMQRGEIDGQMVGLSSVRTGQRDLWNRKAFRPLMAVRPHHAAPGISGHADRTRADQRSRRAFADRFRRAPVLHGAAVRRAARHPGRPRQGAAERLHGDVPGQGLRSTKPRSSAST